MDKVEVFQVRCTICGATFDSTFHECPVCGVDSDFFTLVEEDKPVQASGNQVKCLICGAVFDASIQVCPVCGVGSEHFVPFEQEQTRFRKNTKEVFVILGNGAAGISAAEAIRERNETCSIILVSNEPVLSYNRPKLTKSLSSLVDADEISIHDRSWYQNNNITNQLGVSAVKVEPSVKTVHFEDGSTIQYDKLIVAVGAECFIPAFAGKNKPEVIAIRRLSDVKRIQQMMPNVKSAVVIGGGVLGLEAAWEMRHCGKVTVLEIADKLMGRQLDDAAGAFLAGLIQKTGIEFRLNANITEITGGESVTGVKLEDGSFYPADLILISCGIRSNTEIAKNAGVITENSIKVNEKMETNLKDIYACGDCAEYQGINHALWSQALNMGKTAGANAAGEAVSYDVEPAALTFEAMNTSLYAAGDNGKIKDLEYQTREHIDPQQSIFKKYYFVENRLCGVILIGDTSNLADVTKALHEQRLMQDMI